MPMEGIHNYSMEFTGFLDMNSFQKYPLEESLKQVIIDHDTIFKKQVQELHRLYAVQKSMMKRYSKYTFPERHLMGSTQFVLDDSFLLEDQDFFSRLQQKPLDLRLSTGSSSEDDILDGVEVNLSLSIGRSTNKRSRISGNNWKNKIVYPLLLDVIDLEESNETGSNEEAQPVFSLDQSSRNSTDRLKIGPFCRKARSSMNDGMHQEWSSFNQGSHEQDDVKQMRVVDLDLNKDQPNDSSFHSNEPLEPYPSSDSSYGESCNQIKKPIKVSTSIPTSKQPKSQTSAIEVQTEPCCIDLKSLPEPSSDLSEEKEMHEVIEQKDKEDSDCIIRNAALSLISISLQETSTRNQDSETRSGSNEIENNDEKKKKTIPESSIDSYESLVLKLEESSIDEDSATSKAFEINKLDQKENGIKLRRGRRLKDFQKDILPTLSSLTRHEIWEDINILEGVIRSREYKRLQKAKTGKGENWFTPVRNKRSKVNYVSGRCCLRKKKQKLSYAAEKVELL
ncbi:uncharacterized protein LOC112520659 isoform X2 [Cynara cardunculus var. scolymus]|uniref:uncharacterized protein LOC112520659 isoform X2 n=1 Tax=Cynara cardunculus var. scolymus TaxID=59895 RepID=UPI000D624119|nr:uncharacterized protein LOC112520659 isoform X2 [Cynara cardunculus var. scolymus]